MTQTRIDKNGNELKFCPRCKRWLPLSAFGLSNNTKDNKQPYCIECNREYNRNYQRRKRSPQTNVLQADYAIDTPIELNHNKANFRAWKLITAALYMLFSKNKRNDKIAVYTIAEISRVLSISDRRVNEFMKWIRDYAATNGEIQPPEIIYAKANEYIEEEGEYHRKRNLKAKFLNMRNELLKAGYTAEEINEMQKI